MVRKVSGEVFQKQWRDLLGSFGEQKGVHSRLREQHMLFMVMMAQEGENASGGSE